MPDRFLIVAPPPTPNGGLHVGHLSGPYLAADLIKRECIRGGHQAFLALSTDDHQSYVDVRAAIEGISCERMIAKARADIAETIASFDIACDTFGESDQRYRSFVSDFFREAIAADLLHVADTDVLFDEDSGSCVSEAFVNGHCPHCLNSSSGGICEGCGRPNSGMDLLRGGDERNLTVRKEPRLTLDLESHRAYLTEFLGACRITNPKLRGLLKETMAQPLGTFTLSYKVPRGIAVPVDELSDQKLNVWAEMYPGHFFHLQQACPDLAESDRYVQCFGYDNSYFYAIVHGALSHVAKALGLAWPRPEAFVTNRFYNLGFAKFSTSKGHVVWANDWARRVNSDLARFYLALHGPDNDEASFFPDIAERRIDELAALINHVASSYNESGISRTDIDGWALPSPFDTDVVIHSPRDLATSALSKLSFVAELIDLGRKDVLVQVPLVLKTLLGSLCPRYAASIPVDGTPVPLISVLP